MAHASETCLMASQKELLEGLDAAFHLLLGSFARSEQRWPILFRKLCETLPFARVCQLRVLFEQILLGNAEVGPHSSTLAHQMA